MSTVNQVKVQDFVNFIFSQPDDRLINMRENGTRLRPVCGCVMLQYGKEVLNLTNEFTCSFDSWFLVGPTEGVRPAILSFDRMVGESIIRELFGYHRLSSCAVSNYKEAKEILAKVHESQPAHAFAFSIPKAN